MGLAGRGGWCWLKGLQEAPAIPLHPGKGSRCSGLGAGSAITGLGHSQELRGHLEGQGGSSGPPPSHFLLGVWGRDGVQTDGGCLRGDGNSWM